MEIYSSFVRKQISIVGWFYTKNKNRVEKIGKLGNFSGKIHRKNWVKLRITINKIFLFLLLYFCGLWFSDMLPRKVVDVVKEIYSHRIFGPFSFMCKIAEILPFDVSCKRPWNLELGRFSGYRNWRSLETVSGEQMWIYWCSCSGNRTSKCIVWRNAPKYHISHCINHLRN